IVTCTSVHSRNWRAGNMIGKGDSLDDILEKMGMVVEGVRTTKAAYQLSVEEDVDMPITSGIYDILVNRSEEHTSELQSRFDLVYIHSFPTRRSSDLIVTCTSVHSRNWRAGNMIGKGDSLDDILEKMGMVVEGVRTTKAAYQLSVEEDVDMPITSGIYDILVNDEDPKEMVSQLMNRNRKEEFDQFNMQQWLDK